MLTQYQKSSPALHGPSVPTSQRIRHPCWYGVQYHRALTVSHENRFIDVYNVLAGGQSFEEGTPLTPNSSVKTLVRVQCFTCILTTLMSVSQFLY